MTAVLEGRGLTVGYNGVAVARDLDVEVQPGEVVALLGANGAGKTTTLLSLSGYLPTIAGEVRLMGERTDTSPHRRARMGLALVTEERSVFMRLTVKQNLGIGNCDVDSALLLFPELAPLMSRRAGLLSGGEQQMLTLARALARDSLKVLVADELSLGLAPIIVERLLGAVRSATDRGASVLLVEQHVHRVLEYADRVYVLARGRMVFSGTVQEAKEHEGEIQAHYLGSRLTK
jgi:branched-chain amino acid transport system ATP-binding protein